MNIYLIYLVSGQVIIAKEDPNYVNNSELLELIDPYEIMATPNATNGRLHINLLAFGNMFGAFPKLETLSLNKNHYFKAVQAPKQICDEYIKASSGIIVGS